MVTISFIVQKFKKKMETTREQLAEALYQKGLALAEIETLKVCMFEMEKWSASFIGTWFAED